MLSPWVRLAVTVGPTGGGRLSDPLATHNGGSVQMRKPIRGRVTSAHAIALLALFVALGGSALAVSKASVGTKDIKANAVTTKKIKDAAVKTEKIRDAAVTTSKLADAAVTESKIADAAVTTEKLADNAVTSGKIGDGEIRAGDLGTITTAQTTVQVAANTDGRADAACPAGSVVLSGGGYWTISANNLRTTLKQGNGWRVEGKNTLGASAPLTVLAYCLSG